MSSPLTPASSAAPASDGRSAWTWLLPVLTFVAGVALTAAILGLGSDSDTATSAAEPDPSPSPSPTESTLSPADDELIIQVPAVCVEAAELAESVTAALSDVADAAGALDARRLQESLDVVQAIRPEVEATAQACRDIAADGRIVTPSTSPTATPTPTA